MANSFPTASTAHRIHVPEEYLWFSAKCGSDMLVAISYPFTDQSVRVHRLSGDRLKELAVGQSNESLWLSDRLLVSDFDRKKQSHAIIEFEVSHTRLERHRDLIATIENIEVSRWCAVNDELAIFDYKSKCILHQRCDLGLNFVYRVCACIYLMFFVYVSICI